MLMILITRTCRKKAHHFAGQSVCGKPSFRQMPPFGDAASGIQTPDTIIKTAGTAMSLPFYIRRSSVVHLHNNFFLWSPVFNMNSFIRTLFPMLLFYVTRNSISSCQACRKTLGKRHSCPGPHYTRKPSRKATSGLYRIS